MQIKSRNGEARERGHILAQTSGAGFNDGCGFRSVLVPLDGTAFAEAAIPLAYNIARQNGQIILVQVVPSPDMGLTDVPPAVACNNHEPHPRVLDGSCFGLRVIRAIMYLEQVAVRTATASVEVNWEVRHGLVDSQLLSAATEYNVDAIAIASHPRNLLVRLLHRGISGYLIQYSGRPVLTYCPR